MMMMMIPSNSNPPETSYSNFPSKADTADRSGKLSQYMILYQTLGKPTPRSTFLGSAFGISDGASLTGGVLNLRVGASRKSET